MYQVAHNQDSSCGWFIIPPYASMGVFSLLCVCMFVCLSFCMYDYGFLNGGKR